MRPRQRRLFGSLTDEPMRNPTAADLGVPGSAAHLPYVLTDRAAGPDLPSEAQLFFGRPKQDVAGPVPDRFGDLHDQQRHTEQAWRGLLDALPADLRQRLAENETATDDARFELARAKHRISRPIVRPKEGALSLNAWMSARQDLQQRLDQLPGIIEQLQAERAALLAEAHAALARIADERQHDARRFEHAARQHEQRVKEQARQRTLDAAAQRQAAEKVAAELKQTAPEQLGRRFRKELI